MFRLILSGIGVLVTLGLSLSLGLGLGSASVRGYSDNEVHIAVVTDLGGYLSERAGQGSAVAARLAMEDAAAFTGRTRIRLSVIDHRNDADHAIAEIRSLHLSQGLDAIVEMASPGMPQPLNALAEELGLVALNSIGITATETDACSSLGLHWGPDTYSLGALIAGQIFANHWHLWTLFTPAGVLGSNFQADIGRRINISGAHVAHTVEHPLGGGNVSAELTQALKSDGEAIAIATAGTELRNVIRQGYELGMHTSGKGLAVINMSIFDVQSLGLYVTAGLQFAVPFYWDRTEDSRAFSERFRQRTGTVPSEVHASVYSAVKHYLRAVAHIRSDNPVGVVEAMKALPVDDFYAGGSRVRADGRLLHPMYWVQVKKPGQSARTWDYLEVLETIPADAAFLPMSESTCGPAGGG